MSCVLCVLCRMWNAFAYMLLPLRMPRSLSSAMCAMTHSLRWKWKWIFGHCRRERENGWKCFYLLISMWCQDRSAFHPGEGGWEDRALVPVRECSSSHSKPKFNSISVWVPFGCRGKPNKTHTRAHTPAQRNLIASSKSVIRSANCLFIFANVNWTQARMCVRERPKHMSDWK